MGSEKKYKKVVQGPLRGAGGSEKSQKWSHNLFFFAFFAKTTQNNYLPTSQGGCGSLEEYAQGHLFVLFSEPFPNQVYVS